MSSCPSHLAQLRAVAGFWLASDSPCFCDPRQVSKRIMGQRDTALCTSRHKAIHVQGGALLFDSASTVCRMTECPFSDSLCQNSIPCCDVPRLVRERVQNMLLGSNGQEVKWFAKRAFAFSSWIPHACRPELINKPAKLRWRTAQGRISFRIFYCNSHGAGLPRCLGACWYNLSS